MTQKDKQLLLKDLSARLSHGVKVCIKLPNHQEHIFEEYVGDLKELTRYGGYLVNSKGIDYRSFNLDIKPYLRSMSSMTEEEKKKFDDFCVIDEFVFRGNTEIGHKNQAIIMSDGIDYLNSIHVDYRGLIPMGLALEAPKDMYNIN